MVNSMPSLPLMNGSNPSFANPFVALCRPRTFSRPPRCVTRTFNCTLLVLPRYCSVFSAFRFVQYGGGEADCLRRYRVWAAQGPTSCCAWTKYFRKPQRFVPVGDVRAEM